MRFQLVPKSSTLDHIIIKSKSNQICFNNVWQTHTK